jgi:dienelactone hydrolase
MQVQILYPTLRARPRAVVPWAPPAYEFAPYPVIVFAHGFDVDPNTYRALLVSWAEAGYVVVSPYFPDTSLPAIEAQQGIDTESDEFNQPGDLAFVVSQVAEAGRGKAPASAAYLVGLVNPARLILAGQSDGADTVAALLYDHEYAGILAAMRARPRAVALLSGAEWTRAEDAYSAPARGGPAALVVQSLTDACNDPADSSQLYDMLTGAKWFLALSDATHLGPYVGIGPAAATVERVTAGFFDLEVGRGKMTATKLGRAGNQPGVSVITSAPSVPMFPAPPFVGDPCAAPPGTPTD